MLLKNDSCILCAPLNQPSRHTVDIRTEADLERKLTRIGELPS